LQAVGADIERVTAQAAPKKSAPLIPSQQSIAVS